jgi:hypothetical protein
MQSRLKIEYDKKSALEEALLNKFIEGDLTEEQYYERINALYNVVSATEDLFPVPEHQLTATTAAGTRPLFQGQKVFASSSRAVDLYTPRVSRKRTGAAGS